MVSLATGGRIMLLKQIEYFLAVVDTHSFSEAAERCFISQSAVSQQIRALETELGVTLLERHNRTFSLTAAGEIFYRKCTVLVNDLNAIIHETKAAAAGERSILRIGYLKCYGGYEFQYAVSEFSEKHTDVELEIINGNHEDLYEALRDDRVDLVLNDQRRAFSDDYVNFELVDSRCYIEISSRNSLAKLDRIEAADLKNSTCILVAGKNQQENEETYYRDIVGFKGHYVFAETLQEARLMVASGKGFLPIEGIRDDSYYDSSITRIPLYRKTSPVRRKYCAFWKQSNTKSSAAEFAEILKKQFL